MFSFIRTPNGNAIWSPYDQCTERTQHTEYPQSKFIGETNINRFDGGDETIKVKIFDCNFWTQPLQPLQRTQRTQPVETYSEECLKKLDSEIDQPPQNDIHFCSTSNVISYLKSLIQKAVRRRKVEHAVSASKELLIWSPTQFLRRFPIIIIEDSILDVDISGVVWLMLATNMGYKLTKKDLDWLLSLVYKVASSEIQDPVPNDPNNIRTCFDLGDIQQFAKIDEKNASAIVSIVLRARYGGTKGDMRMMKRSALIWSERLLSVDQHTWLDYLTDTNEDNLINSDNIHFEPNYHTLLEATDFHCFPWIATRLSKQFGINVKTVKKAIWMGNSCINVKNTLNQSEKVVLMECDEWNQLEPHFLELASRVLKKWILFYLTLKNNANSFVSLAP